MVPNRTNMLPLVCNLRFYESLVDLWDVPLMPNIDYMLMLMPELKVKSKTDNVQLKKNGFISDLQNILLIPLETWFVLPKFSLKLPFSKIDYCNTSLENFECFIWNFSGKSKYFWEKKVCLKCIDFKTSTWWQIGLTLFEIDNKRLFTVFYLNCLLEKCYMIMLAVDKNFIRFVQNNKFPFYPEWS